MKRLTLISFFLLLLTFQMGVTCQLYAGDDNPITITFQSKEASNADAKDGYIKLSVKGGVPPYTIYSYSSNELLEKVEGDQIELKKIKPGTFLFVVQDSKNQYAYKYVELTYKK
ncbi:MAG TPA: hypothetical protein VIK89_14050 [Cytophagaceae bacterium]